MVDQRLPKHTVRMVVRDLMARCARVGHRNTTAAIDARGTERPVPAVGPLPPARRAVEGARRLAAGSCGVVGRGAWAGAEKDGVRSARRGRVGAEGTKIGAGMETVGFMGVGKIGLPVCENLIKSGYKVLGYRRGSLADFEKVGGTPAKSPADIGRQCNVVFSCVPTAEAMDEVVNGANGLIHSARPGQII